MTRTYLDARTMARTLRETLATSGVDISHSRALEVVAAQFGFRDWNTLAAAIENHDDDGSRSPSGVVTGTGSGIRFDAVIPLLRILDVDRAREFYLDFLGFEVDFEHRFEPDLPLFFQVSRAGAALQLSEHHGDGVPGATVFIWMQNIEAFRDELLSKRYRYARPGIESQEWGRELEVTDPFGNRLRFCEAHRASAERPSDG